MSPLIRLINPGFYVFLWDLIFCSHSREGRSNAHIKGDSQRIGDVMLKNIQALRVRSCSVRQCDAVSLLFHLHSVCLQPLTGSLHKQSEALLELEKACRSCPRLEDLCRDFELQKVCYVPLNVFILRPLHRLVHYKQILERLCKHYAATHADFRDCRGTAFRLAPTGGASTRITSCQRKFIKVMLKTNVKSCACK